MNRENSEVITLKELIKQKGLTQRGLAQKTGIKERTINSWVSKEHYPTIDNAVKLAIALNTDLKTLAQSIGIDTTGLPNDQ